MALILAINPGNSHSPTLARLARELKGCELIGADSCAVAITAINRRVPDLVLLPDRPPKGEAELQARLRAVRGGVPAMKMPPVSSADPVALARDIRTLLAGPPSPPAAPPVPVGPSPHLVAAAKAAIAWIRVRRASWAAADLPPDASSFAPASPHAATSAAAPRVGPADTPAGIPAFAPTSPLSSARYACEPEAPDEGAEPESLPGDAAGPRRGAASRWLPRWRLFSS